MYKLKGIIIIFVFSISILFFSFKSCAEEYDYGVNELNEAVPEEISEYYKENNISADGTGISDISFDKMLSGIIELISANIKQPILMFTSLLAVIILTSVLGGLNDAVDNSSTRQVFSIVSALTAIIIISSYLSTALNGINNAISSASGFMLTYIPVIAGVIAIGGHASTAAVFSSIMMISIQILTQITTNVLFPLTSCLIGISAAGGINKDLKIDKLGEGLRKAVIWGLGLIMTIFIGFLTLQSNITASADTVTLRAARFAVSTSVPFVGGAVSDALSTVKASIELLKTGIGSFGILTGVCLLFPVLINALCYRFFLFLSGIISEILGSDDTSRMIKCGENALSIVISMIICFFVFIIISTALLLLICRR